MNPRSEMTPLRLILQSIRFYWRSHLGTVAGTAVGSMVLVGSFLVGDSVRETLRNIALLRVGSSEWVLSSGDRYFREALATELADRVANSIFAPALLDEGSVHIPDGSQTSVTQWSSPKFASGSK